MLNETMWPPVSIGKMNFRELEFPEWEHRFKSSSKLIFEKHIIGNYILRVYRGRPYMYLKLSAKSDPPGHSFEKFGSYDPFIFNRYVQVLINETFWRQVKAKEAEK
jgi:hypothetical protein